MGLVLAWELSPPQGYRPAAPAARVLLPGPRRAASLYNAPAGGLVVELLRPELDVPPGPALHGRFLLAPPGLVKEAGAPRGGRWRRRLRLPARPGPWTTGPQARRRPGLAARVHASPGGRPLLQPTRPPLSPDGPARLPAPGPRAPFRLPSAARASARPG